MQDDARALREHGREQGAIQTHSWHEVEVELLGPFGIGKRCEATGWSRRSADHVDQYVDAAKVVECRIDRMLHSVGTSEIGSDVLDLVQRMRRT